MWYNSNMEILNYQGNKHKLLPFIDDKIKSFLSKDKALLDIFCGGCSVTNYFAKKYPVISNDLEPYSAVIANATLLSNRKKEFDDVFLKKFMDDFNLHFSKLFKPLKSYVAQEKFLLANHSPDYSSFSETIPTFWNGKINPIIKEVISSSHFKTIQDSYSLFTCFYSNNYFGLLQAMQIDSLRFAIAQTERTYNTDYLFLCLFGSMNKCVFSKDGHMAQPLNISKNFKRALATRSKSILTEFSNLLNEYNKEEIFNSKISKAYNKNFVDLLGSLDSDEIGCIYADPPYTDMQYSRYYHLLNTVLEYKIESPTLIGGKFSSGLYLNNRRQSNISKKGTFASTFSLLLKYSSEKSIPLVISFGYPTQDSGEQHNRYLIAIDDLISMAKTYFGSENVKVHGVDYSHANQRKSIRKKVVEYLIVCGGKKND